MGILEYNVSFLRSLLFLSHRGIIIWYIWIDILLGFPFTLLL